MYQALIYFEYCFPEGQEEETRTDSLRLSVLLNSAACFLKLGQFNEVINMCRQALNLDKCNVKALYRRAVALRSQDRFSEVLSF